MSRPNSPSVSRSGFTLLELSTVLFLLGISLSALLPAALYQSDRAAVLGAREEVAGFFHRARFEAVTHGGAILHLEIAPASVGLLFGGEMVERSDLGKEYGVALELSRGRSDADLHFDALGLGRVASQTLTFTRGEARALLVISAYGRMVRR